MDRISALYFRLNHGATGHGESRIGQKIATSYSMIDKEVEEHGLDAVGGVIGLIFLVVLALSSIGLLTFIILSNLR
jgi:hypothetical protein